MKLRKITKLFLSLVLAVFVFAFGSVFSVKVDASSNISLTDGAQIRTTGKEGIRFIASINELSSYKEFGFVCSKGKYTLEEMKTAFENVDTWAVNSTAANGFVYSAGSSNSINMIKAGKENSETGSTDLTLTIYNINETNYLTNLSVFVYGLTEEGTYEFSEINVSRNVAEIALYSKVNGNSSTLLDSIVTYAKNNYKKADYDLDGNYAIADMNKFLASELAILYEEFVTDTNDTLGTNLTVESTYEEFSSVFGYPYDGTAEVIEGEVQDWWNWDNTGTDISGTNVYKFFNDSKMGIKWQWVLDYLYENGAVNTQLQVHAVQKNNGLYDESKMLELCETYSDELNGGTISGLFGGNHIACEIWLILNQESATYTYDQYGYLNADYTDSAKYDTIAEYLNGSDGVSGLGFIYYGADLYQVNSSVTFPDGLEKDGYTFAGWSDGTNVYNSNNKYVVDGTSLSFTPVYELNNYTINYYDNNGNLLEGLTPTTYTIESEEITLPEYAEEGYEFLGWCTDPEYTEGTEITTIAAGSTGDVNVYAKVLVLVNVTFDTNDGVFTSANITSDPVNTFTVSEYSNTGMLTDVIFMCDTAILANNHLQYQYKILLNYDEAIDAYEVVAVDSATTKAASLGVDWTHAICLAATTGATDISKYASVGQYIVVNKDDLSVDAKVYDESEFKSHTTVLTTSQTLPVPVKEGYEFEGWLNSLDGQIYTEFPVYTVNPGDITYTAQWFYDNYLVVNDDWSTLTTGDAVTVDSREYIMGTDAFATISDAIAVATEDAIINVLAGTYADSFTISTNNVTLVGPNSEITANGTETRVEEAIISGIITLGTSNTNVTIKGFKLVDEAQVVSATTTTSGYYVSGFTFAYNYVDKGTSTTLAIDFECADLYTYNITIDNCYFTASSLTATFVDSSDSESYPNALITIYNNDNLTVTNSTFENIGGSAVAIYDTANAAGFRQNLTVENNTFKTIVGSALWINYTNFKTDATYTISIKKNLFEDIDGQACIDFEECGARHTAASFVISENTFKDVYKGLWTVVDGAEFTNNKYYLYNGDITSGYIIRGGSHLNDNGTYYYGYITCDGNLFLSADGTTVYTALDVSYFNSRVSGYAENNYESLDAFEEAVGINRYTITFDTDGGTDVESIKQEVGTEVVLPENPTKEGYTFLGWDTEIPSVMPAYDMTITALWEVNEYTITYYNGDTILSESVYTVEDKVSLVVLSNTTSLEFLGWYENAELTGDVVTTIAVGTTGDKAYYASWVEAYNALYVDAAWAENVEGDEVTVNDTIYVIGTTAHATIADALAMAQTNATIYVAAGTYAESFTISKNGVTLVGPNNEITANGNGTRVDEAILSGIITLDANSTNVTIKGFKLVDEAQVVSATTTTSGYYVSGFTFAYNYVDKGTSTTAAIALECGDLYTYNIVIDNCYFTANSIASTADVVSIYNNDNFTVTNSTFENISGSALAIYDSTNGAGLRRNLTMEDNIFKTIVGSALWVNYTNFDVDAAYTIFIKNNLFEDIDGGACIDFEGCGARHTAATFDITGNTFNDVYKGVWTLVDGANFTNNKIYLYAGSKTSGYVVKGGSYYNSTDAVTYTATVTCGGNLYLSADGTTVYTAPSSNGFTFNTRVTDYDANNYASIEEYEAALAE